MEYIYAVEKHVTTEWIVTVSKEGTRVREPVVKCNSEGTALTIKGMYERDDAMRSDE